MGILYNLLQPMRYKKGDIVTIAKDHTLGNGYVLKKGTEVEIAYVDNFLKTYDIISEGTEYTEFSDIDFK